jgi:hypothetical protein
MMFLVIDEFENVFESWKFGGNKVARAVNALNTAYPGRVRLVLTGSSVVLRELCFAELPMCLLRAFPSYDRLDFNDTKALWWPLAAPCSWSDCRIALSALVYRVVKARRIR